MEGSSGKKHTYLDLYFLQHLCAFSFCVFVLIYSWTLMKNDWAYYLFYLTDLVHFLITIYFGITLYRHVLVIRGHIDLNSKKEEFYNYKNSDLLRALVPISTLIAVVFWSTYLYDKQFFLNEGYWPVWIYVCLHFLNSCFLWLEVFRFDIATTSEKFLMRLLKTTFFFLLYITLNLVYKGIVGKWVYTVQEKVSFWIQLLLLIPMILLTVAFDLTFLKATKPRSNPSTYHYIASDSTLLNK